MEGLSWIRGRYARGENFAVGFGGCFVFFVTSAFRFVTAVRRRDSGWSARGARGRVFGSRFRVRFIGDINFLLE